MSGTKMGFEDLKKLRKAFGCYNTDRSQCEHCSVLLEVVSNPRYRSPIKINHDANEALRKCDFSSPNYPSIALEQVKEYAKVS